MVFPKFPKGTKIRTHSALIRSTTLACISFAAQPAFAQTIACPISGEYLEIYSFAVFDDTSSPLSVSSETPKGSTLETTGDVIERDGKAYTYVYAFVSKNADGTYQTAEGYVKSDEIKPECD